MRNTFKRVALGLALLCATTGLLAQPAGLSMPVPVAAPAEPNAIPLYANVGSTSTEYWSKFMGSDVVVRNVTRPTLTPVLPAPGKATGAAVVIAPGGAFMLLAMDHEGWKVAKAFADRGIAAFVLKYRLIPTPEDTKTAFTEMGRRMAEGLRDPAKQPTLQYPPSTDDGLAALAMVRANAQKWGVDPQRVGMIGFSAGAMTTLNTVVAAKPGAGPNFFGYIYGPMAAIEVRPDAPPMFAAIAYNDALLPPRDLALAGAWRAANRPVELHVYQSGGHGFGLGAPGTTHALWFDNFITWLDMQGFLKPAPKSEHHDH